MSVNRRLLAGLSLAASLPLVFLAACSGNSGIVPNAPVRNALTGGAAPARDLGRRRARGPVRLVVLLRYNHAAELTRFVDALHKERRPAYLSREAFIARFAPTPAQEARVTQALEHAGFQITQRFANRLVLDVIAPSVTVERFFSTEIHDFAQSRYGVRTANVRPLHIPPALANDVAAVDANTLVLARPDLRIAPLPKANAAVANPNVILNGGFETGKLAPWTSCGSVAATISRKAENGRYAALVGSAKTFTGWSAICQQVTIPANGVLSAWFYRKSNDWQLKDLYQEVALADSAGKPSKVLWRDNVDIAQWMHETWDLSQYAGKKETIFFGVHGDGHKGSYSEQIIDGVTLEPPTAARQYGPSKTWGPGFVTRGFAFPATQGTIGEGQTVAIVIDSTVSISDVQSYLQYFGINEPSFDLVNESVDGGGPPDSTGEATLDAETILGLAPRAHVIVYDVGAFDNQEIEDAYNQVVSDGRATVVNSSFGECESLDPTFPSVSDTIAVGAAAQGITFSAASGDTGVQCYAGASTYQSGVSAPASNPHFVAVGGTQSGHATPPPAGSAIRRDASTSAIANPVVWSDAMGAGGSGISAIWSPPPNQAGVSGVVSSGRNIPDIALPAVNDALFIEGNWYQIWGTSWASPTYVAMQTEINELCGKPQWGISELYNAFEKSGYQSDFIDVTSGANGQNGYTATTGFDQASGIGMPLGIPLASSVCAK